MPLVIHFKKFASGRLSEDDPFGYIGQISAYAEAKQDKEAAFFVINKQSGELTLLKIHEMEMINAEDRVKYLKKIIKKIHHLVGVISLYLMVQVGTISFLLVAFTVRTSICVGLILTEVKDFVLSNMRKGYEISYKSYEST